MLTLVSLFTLVSDWTKEMSCYRVINGTGVRVFSQHAVEVPQLGHAPIHPVNVLKAAKRIKCQGRQLLSL